MLKKKQPPMIGGLVINLKPIKNSALLWVYHVAPKLRRMAECFETD